MPMQNLLLLTELKALGMRPCRIFFWCSRRQYPPVVPGLVTGRGLMASNCSEAAPRLLPQLTRSTAVPAVLGLTPRFLVQWLIM